MNTMKKKIRIQAAAGALLAAALLPSCSSPPPPPIYIPESPKPKVTYTKPKPPPPQKTEDDARLSLFRLEERVKLEPIQAGGTGEELKTNVKKF